MKISMIIPIYNESKNICNFLEQIKNLSGNWEIIFAEGGSTDNTLSLINDQYKVISCPKGRGKQMNTGAKMATGQVLFFVHCDSILPQTAYEEIKSAVENGAEFGCFHIKFDCNSTLMKINSSMSNFRAKQNKIAFGDQGIFVNKELFTKQKGFPDLPLMEDYEFSRIMKKQKIPLTFLNSTIITSSRRYHKKFPLLTMLQMMYLRFLYRLGVDINKITYQYNHME